MPLDLSAIAAKTVGTPKVDLAAIAKSTTAPVTKKKPQWFFEWLKEDAKRFIAPSVGVLSWIAQVGENTVGRLADYGSHEPNAWLNKVFWTNVQDNTNQRWISQQLATSALWQDITSNPVYKWSEFVGKQLPTIAATDWLWNGASIAGKFAIWWLQWAASTQLQNIADTWKPASLWQTAAGAGIGALFGWLWWLTSKAKAWFYDSAFSQANTSTKKELAKYWQTAWWAVMEQNLSPNIKKWLVQIKDKLGNTRETINNTADEAGNIVWSNIKWSLKQDIIQKLWYDKLNQTASSTKNLINKVSSIVDDMIPDGTITPKEIVTQIKNLNNTLSDSLVAKWLQDVKWNAKITKVIENGLKTALDKHIENNWWWAWVISKLYQQYGKEKTVQKILQNEEVRKILGRQLAWSTLWWGIGTLAWYEDFKQWNLIWWWAKVLWGILLGKKAAELSTNPNILMKAWQAADLIGKALQQWGKLSWIFTSLLRK